MAWSVICLCHRDSEVSICNGDDSMCEDTGEKYWNYDRKMGQCYRG